MKIFHLSDLHIGMMLCGYDLADIQRDMLDQVLGMVRSEQPDVILIAGDIYDKAAPSGEAFEIFDAFLTSLAQMEPQVPVLIIAGNHDNARRLKYAGTLLRSHQIYISTMPPQEAGDHLMHLQFEDAFGPVHFWLLPFFKPGYVRKLAMEAGVEVPDYQAALAFLLGREDIDFKARNVLVAHQYFISGDAHPSRSDSELSALAIGGLDSIDAGLVKDFDYVALGHIHGPQQVLAPHIRYCGTPYKYSASEADQVKAVQVVTLEEKGSTALSQIPFVLRPDVRRIRGTLAEVLAAGRSAGGDDFVSITLTDEEIYRPRMLLDEIYSRILDVQVDNERTRHVLEEVPEAVTALSPFEAFQDFYMEMNGARMNEAQEQALREIIDQVSAPGRS